MKKNSKNIDNNSLKLIEELFIKSENDTFEEFDNDFFQYKNAGDIISTQYVNFQVGSEFYAITINHVIEIVKVPRITYLPSAGNYIIGLMNLRGNIIPVVNTHKLFGIPPIIEDENARIIIIEVERSNLGFYVDSVSQVIELNENDIDTPMVTLEVERTEYIMGETTINGKLVAILNIEKLVNNEIFVNQ